jgi:hypothetical protein
MTALQDAAGPLRDVPLLFPVREAPGSQLGDPTVARGLPQYLQANAGMYTKSGHGLLLPNPLQFIIH